MIGLDKYKAIFLTLTSCILYFYIGYFIERTAFNTLLFTWFSLFICFYFLMKSKPFNFKYLAGISILFRLVILFQIPNLSQDFYRFIWDGRMILEGLNPYLSLPETYIQQGLKPISEAVTLYEGMGELNGSHYTNYPPLHQICFLIAALFSSKSILGSIVVLRVLIILADIGILYFGKKLLEKLNLPVQNIFWYVLNPFIIIEMTGNLHFESIMLFFLVCALYKLTQKKWRFAGVLIAGSISVKLIPFLFLPLFCQWFTKPKNLENKLEQINDKSSNGLQREKWNLSFTGIKNLIAFYGIILVTIIALFLPFYSPELISNYLKSVGLWFQKFEFNASFYYLFREIGYLFRGWNEIAIIGKITPILTLIFIGYLTFFRKNSSIRQLITALLFGSSFYYFTTTTMHPWYLATLLILSVFTKYRFTIVWSFAIILSYQAYANTPWNENLWFVGLEYLIVFLYLIFELKKKNNILLT
ncbi:MAG: mannosyltransferase [Polaribacter sp.]|jgi:alpha-1,6-mannosyltransferase|nr:mannosyltransferase [Polaribacter sp.]